MDLEAKQQVSIVFLHHPVMKTIWLVPAAHEEQEQLACLAHYIK